MSSGAEVVTEQTATEVIDKSLAAQRRTRGLRRRLGILAIQLVFLVVLIAIWQLLVEANVLKPLFTSSPWPVAQAFWHELDSASFRSALYGTLYEAFVGFAISAVAGFILGLILFEIPIIYLAIRPFVTLFNNLPRLVLAPILVLYLGTGPNSRIALVVSISLIIVLLNTLAGLEICNPDHLALANALGASRYATFTKFRLPSAIPTIFVGLQLALTNAVVGAIVGELITGGSGLGALIAGYAATYRSDYLMADIFVMAILGTLLSGIMRIIENRCLRWRRYEFGGSGRRD